MPNPCHSDAGCALPGTVEVVVLFEDSGTLALLRERGTGFKPKRCQASHAFRLSPPVPGFFWSKGTLMALAPTQCTGSCISWHISMIRSIEEVENLTLTRVIALHNSLANHLHVFNGLFL